MIQSYMKPLVDQAIFLPFRLLVIFSTADVLWWCWADRRLRVLKRHMLWRGLLAALMVGLIGLLVWWLSPTGKIWHMPQGLPKPFTAALFLWHMFALPVGLLAALIYGLARIGGAIARLVAKKKERQPVEPPVDSPLPRPGLSRRQFLGVTAAAAAPLVLASSVAAGLRQQGEFRVRRLELAFPNLPPSLDGLKISHISDNHVGPFTTPEMLRNIAETSNAMDPDLVLLTGDLINHEMGAMPDAVEFVRRLRARSGVFMCLGNHDLIESPQTFVDAVRGELPDVRLLINQATQPKGLALELLGINWARKPEEQVQVLRPMIDPDPRVFRILLAHHPHAFDSAAAAGIDLTLSGHTHGGQLMLTPTLGAGNVLFRYLSGVYPRERTTGPALVVSNGVGNWFPLRINAPAEIGLIRLKRA